MPKRDPKRIAINRIYAAAMLSAAIAFAACKSSNQMSPEETEVAKAAFQSCLVCHSAQEMQRGPIIDGMPAWYSKRQLIKFRDGIRGEKPDNRSEFLMASAKDRIGDDRQIDLLARYIESLPLKERHPVTRGDAKRGETLYIRCVACHGSQGQGNPQLKSPPLDIQEDWYMLDQLRKFAKGHRGYHANDIEGQQMAAALIGLEDQDFKDLIAYMQSFGIQTSLVDH